MLIGVYYFFFVKQKTAYEMRISDWSSDVCSSDLIVERDPEIYALLVQVLRRLRNATRLVDRMAAHTSLSSNTELVDKRLDKSLDRFLSRKKWRIGMLTSNLRLDSSHFRYACRVAIAAQIGRAHV